MNDGEERSWLAGYFHEPRVWPITFVLLAHGVLAVAIALLDVWREGGTLGWIVLAAAAAGTGYAIWRSVRRRALGLATPTLLGLWAFGALTAWAADRTGLY